MEAHIKELGGLFNILHACNCSCLFQLNQVENSSRKYLILPMYITETETLSVEGHIIRDCASLEVSYL